MAGRFDGGSLNNLIEQTEGPSAPTGLTNLAGEAAEGVRADQQNGPTGRFEGSRLAKLVAEGEGAAAARGWYTGANNTGLENGWTTEFWDKAMEQNTALGESG